MVLKNGNISGQMYKEPPYKRGGLLYWEQGGKEMVPHSKMSSPYGPKHL